MNVFDGYYFDARPEWRRRLFPRFPVRVSAGWVYALVGSCISSTFRELPSPYAGLCDILGCLIWLYGMLRVWSDD